VHWSVRRLYNASPLVARSDWRLVEYGLVPCSTETGDKIGELSESYNGAQGSSIVEVLKTLSYVK
jgi:hypothetical protein